MKYILSAVVIIAITISILFENSPPNFDNYSSQIINNLKQRLEDKNTLIKDTFNAFNKMANGALNSDEFGGVFRTLGTQKQFPVRTKTLLDEYYVKNLSPFFDVLAIDARGDVFWSIKEENDLGQNIFNGDLSSTKLAKTLSNNKDDSFVDFEIYDPSNEAAAFFAFKQDYGWLVFQLPLNSLNTMLFSNGKFAQSGETYLVNTSGKLLSNSRFVNTPTSLQISVHDDVLSNPNDFHIHTGEFLDYRGVEVYSAYQLVEFKGVIWTLVVEIDRDEIRANYAIENSNEVVSRLHSTPPHKTEKNATAFPANLTDKNNIRVDINEFSRAKPTQNIFTYGVSTCTAVALKNERFTYLGHVVPIDASYQTSAWQWLLKVFPTKWEYDMMKRDLITEMLDTIESYEIADQELLNLKADVIAVKPEGISGVIQKLLTRGIRPSNINIHYEPQAQYVNVQVSSDTEIIQFIENDPTKGNLTSGTWNLARLIDRM